MAASFKSKCSLVQNYFDLLECQVINEIQRFFIRASHGFFVCLIYKVLLWKQFHRYEPGNVYATVKLFCCYFTD